MACSLVLTGCGDAGGPEKPEKPVPVAVKVTKVEPTSQTEGGRYSGTVEAKTTAALSFFSAGTIRSLSVGVGDHVRRGQLVGTLDATSAVSSHEAARAALAQAEDAWRRMKELHDRGSLADIKWVEVESKLAQARSVEAVARKQVADCRLVAPFDGIVSEKMAEAGQNVLPGVPVFRLVASGGWQVRIDVPEGEIGGVEPGLRARIAVPALGGRTYEGRVVERGVSADALSRSYEVKLSVNGNGDDLLPGMVTEVSLLQPGTSSAYVLPAGTIQIDDSNRTFVWLARQGKAARRFVSLGAYVPGGVEVTEGLSEGDLVIVEGQQKVSGGTPVRF